jgi:uronate dehydrogenase
VHRDSILITGAAGTIGSILAAALSGDADVTCLDLVDAHDSADRQLVRGDVGDRDLLQRMLESCDVVVHLATGASRGWDGLLEVEIRATKQLFDLAAVAGIRRVVLASTNHVAGGFELDYFRRGGSPVDRDTDAAVVQPTDPIRPDSPYGAAKAFGEAYGRFTAETTATAVSCLRIGTVAPSDDPTAYASSPQYAHIPKGAEGAARRLRATWLSHPDLIRLMREEFAASERFRLRFGVSDNPGRFWSLETYCWNGDSLLE